MTDNDDTGQPARLPALEKGLRFRDRGRLGKLPDEASGSEWAAMLQGTGYGSSAWWGHKINRAIRQRDLKATTRGIIKRAEILRWLEQYDAMLDGWRTLTVHTPAISASTSSSLSEKAAPAPERTILGEMANYLPLREQARLGYLPDALHVEQIATLEHLDNRDLALAYAKVLRKACKECELTSTEEQYQDWWIEDGATGEVSQKYQWWHKKLELGESGATPLIDKTAYRDWLLQKGLPLPTWWFPTSIHSSAPKNIPSIPEIMNQPGSQLSLAERAKCGLLYNEFELWLQEIMELEFPALTSYEDRQRLERVNWQKSIEVAIQYGMLSGCQQQAAVQSQTHYYQDARRAYFSGPRERAIHFVGCGGDWRIPREPYRVWRAIQPNPPTGSIIHLWLGTTVLPAISELIEPPLPAPIPDTGRQIALVEAEDKALAVLRNKLKREPDFEEFWVHITEHDDTGTVAESTDDRLMWIGKDGRNCETAKSTMRNRLAAAKKRNPFGQEPIP